MIQQMNTNKKNNPTIIYKDFKKGRFFLILWPLYFIVTLIFYVFSSVSITFEGERC